MTIGTVVPTHRVYLADLRTPVTVQVWACEDGWQSISTSHRVRTPRNAEVTTCPRRPSISSTSAPDELARWTAKHRETEVGTAIEAEHTPREARLVAA